MKQSPLLLIAVLAFSMLVVSECVGLRTLLRAPALPPKSPRMASYVFTNSDYRITPPAGGRFFWVGYADTSPLAMKTEHREWGISFAAGGLWCDQIANPYELTLPAPTSQTWFGLYRRTRE